jgi:hypothetical protein
MSSEIERVAEAIACTHLTGTAEEKHARWMRFTDTTKDAFRQEARAAIAAMQPQWRTDEMRAALEFIASGDGDPQLIAQQALDAIALPAPPAALAETER